MMQPTPPWKIKRAAQKKSGAPQDYTKCAVATYLWGKDTRILVDCLVLGYSLDHHGVKARKEICVNEDTRENNMHRLLERFWQIIPVQHAELPKHLKGTEIDRLKGVYSKMQTWKIFAGEGSDHLDRVALLDADMRVRANIDEPGS